MLTVRVIKDWLKTMPPANTIALVGSGSVFSWIASRLLNSGGLEHCAPLLRSAAAACPVQPECDCDIWAGQPLEHQDLLSDSWLVNLIRVATGPHNNIFWIGVSVGACLFPVIDLLHLAKARWQRFILRHSAALFRPDHLPPEGSDTYNLGRL